MNGSLLAFHQGRQKNDLAVWELESVVMGGSFVFVDLSEDRGPKADLRYHEEKLRTESMALIHGDPELSRRLAVIETAMALIFAYTLDHKSRSDNEATMQMLGIRLFNVAASGVKLALSGYYQTAFQQARDIMETGFLFDYFRKSRQQIGVWRRQTA